VWHKQTGEHLDRGRLARTVWTQEPKELTCLHPQIESIDGSHYRKVPGQSLCFNRQRHGNDPWKSEITRKV
jgi:hypothetical protein